MEQITNQVGTHNAGWRLLRGALGFLTTAGALIAADGWTLPGWDDALQAFKPGGAIAQEWVVFLIGPVISFCVGLLTSETPDGQGR